MGSIERFFLVRGIMWLWRWLSSNDKNRKEVEDRIMNEVVDAVHKALENKHE